MEPNGTSDLVAVLRGQSLPSPPIWLMRQAGRYLPEYRQLRKDFAAARGGEGGGDDFLEFCRSREATRRAARQPLDRFPDLSAAIVFSDILILLPCLEREVSFKTGGPKLEPLKSAQEVRACVARRRGRAGTIVPEALEDVAGNVSALVEDLKEAERNGEKKRALIGFSGAPWTLACYLLNGGGGNSFAGARAFLREEPEAVQELLSLLEEYVIEFLRLQWAAGAEAVQLFDSWAGLLDPGDFVRFSCRPARRIFKAVRDFGESAQDPGLERPAPERIFHARGSGVRWPDAARILSGLRVALSPDSACDLGSLARELQDGVALQGNLDPSLLTPARPDAEWRKNLSELASAMRGRPWIVNLGGGLLPETDPDRVRALTEKVAAMGAAAIPSRPGLASSA